MKILHIAEAAQGVDRYLSMLLPLLEMKFEQAFICSNKYECSHYEGVVDKVYPMAMQRTASVVKIIKVVSLIRNIIKEESPSVVYCHSSFAGVLGRLACFGLKCKIVYNPHGWSFNMQDMGWIKRIVFLNIERILSIITDRIVCISRAEYYSAIRNHVGRRDTLEIIENGIDIVSLDRAVPIDRSALGWKDTDYVIGMIGRLEPQKAPDIFIKAGKLIKDVIPNAKFIIVGNGFEEEMVKDYAKEHGLDLFITGWVNNPYSYLKMFDLAMLLSRWEGFGLCIAEYMAARKPVIATRVDAIPTLIDDGENGLLVEVDSPEDVKAKVMYLYNNKEEAEEMKERAYQKALKQFDIHRVATQHIELLTGLLGGVICKIVSLLPLASERERRWAA